MNAADKGLSCFNKRPGILFMALVIGGSVIIFLTALPLPCLGNEIAVELVWNYGDDAWVQVEVNEGSYTLFLGEDQIPMKQGEKIQLGATAFGPIMRLNDDPFRYCQSPSMSLKDSGSGSFSVLTPDQTLTTYRGRLDISWNGERWCLVNRLDEEEYLRGVVPIEMSNSWAATGFEALKAQAVAARTYMVKFAKEGKITDSPNIHQAYLGKSVEGAASEAVEATRGEILVDRVTGLPINVYYSAHNGGYSEETQNVWLNHDPHYKSRPDPFSLGFGGVVAEWSFLISAVQLGETFGMGPIRRIELDKFPSGRVNMVRMVDWQGNMVEVKGKTFVQKFYPYGKKISADSFLGTLFNVTFIPTYRDSVMGEGTSSITDFLLQRNKVSPQIDGNRVVGPRLANVISSSDGLQQHPQPFGAYRFNGRGWGHGVGMSQWGAYRMAQLGYSYKDILMFYYDHTTLAIRD